MREKLIRWMQGRYGLDSLGRILLGIGLVLLFISGFQFRGSFFLSILSWGILIFSYFRVFSRNIGKRYQENQLFLKKTQKIRNFFKKKSSLMREKKTFRIYTCPSCHQKIRVPKNKGKIEVQCPKCRTKFIKIS